MPKTRREVIDLLVKDWMQSIEAEGPQVALHIFLHGFKGYDNYSDAELLDEARGTLNLTDEDLDW